jgi:hypothetical protein
MVHWVGIEKVGKPNLWQPRQTECCYKTLVSTCKTGCHNQQTTTCILPAMKIWKLTFLQVEPSHLESLSIQPFHSVLFITSQKPSQIRLSGYNSPAMASIHVGNKLNDLLSLLLHIWANGLTLVHDCAPKNGILFWSMCHDLWQKV